MGLLASLGKLLNDLRINLILGVQEANEIRFSVCILLLILGTIVDANAASTLKMTCTGQLTNTPADGVTLGQCDLNFISVKQMDEIKSVCGLFGTIDTPAENQCRIFHRR
jgi:hypothetical protein